MEAAINVASSQATPGSNFPYDFLSKKSDPTFRSSHFSPNRSRISEFPACRECSISGTALPLTFTGIQKHVKKTLAAVSVLPAAMKDDMFILVRV